MKKGKVIRVENDIVTIGMNNGSIKEVRRCDLGFDPVLGDLVEIFEDEDQIIVTKAKKEPENHNDFGKRETGILDLYMLAFKLAKEQLKISKED